MSRWFATCPKGMEYLLRDELAALGAQDAHEALAGVHFEGPLETAYRACLWSRLASRILLPLAEFDATTDDALYAGVQAIDWSQHLAAHATLAVDAHTALSKLTHSQFIAQRVKDAVVDQFRQQGGTRPGVDTEEPDVRLNLRLKRDRATLSLDLAGSPLHRRGWRELQGEAPLKENLAAAMLLRARWPEIYAAGGALLDPMCGSGTLLIEGALMAADVAPGWRRDYYGFLGWQQHDLALWRGLLDEARQRAETGLTQLRPCFFGSDADPRMVQTAKRNAQEAGVAGRWRSATWRMPSRRPVWSAAWSSPIRRTASVWASARRCPRCTTRWASACARTSRAGAPPCWPAMRNWAARWACMRRRNTRCTTARWKPSCSPSKSARATRPRASRSRSPPAPRC